jgi:hypothetical protein
VNALLGVFAGLAIYGLSSSKLGAGLISLGMCGVVLYGKRELAKRQAEYLADPRSARTPIETVTVLEQSHTEASRTSI